jgi:hypothetical protein
MLGPERREFQRLTLEKPVPGTFGATAVTIMEAGVLGARVQHSAALDDKHAELHFTHRGEEIALKCEVMRTITPDGAPVIESGLRFVAAIGESGDRLRNMLAELVSRELNLRKNTPLGDTPIDGDKTVRGKDAQFLCYRLDGTTWNKRRVFLPEQPPAGFTVARGEDSEEMQRLCRLYQVSDDEGRRLIRLFAELSISDALQIPPTE